MARKYVTHGIAAGALVAGVLSAPALVVSAQAAEAPEGGVIFDCTIPAFSSTLEFPTTVTLAARAVSGKVQVTAQLDDIPITTVPVPLDDTPMSGAATGTVEGQAVTFTGATVVDIPARTPIPTPAMTGAVTSAAKLVDITIHAVDFVAKHPSMDVAVNCVAAAPFTASGVPVKQAAVAARTTSVTTVKYDQKAQKATVTTTVKADKKNANGKVRITVKKGKKTVVNKLVKLKKGKAKLVLKKGKLKAKGKYVVTAKYQGNKSFKASAAKKKSFKVKK